MFRKKIIVPHRVRQVTGSFGFIPHRFLAAGYWASLSSNELLLYLFLVTVSDQNGLSYYGGEKICTLLHLSYEKYLDARDRLIARDLIAVDDLLFQVLELPTEPVRNLPQKCC